MLPAQTFESFAVYQPTACSSCSQDDQFESYRQLFSSRERNTHGAWWNLLSSVVMLVCLAALCFLHQTYCCICCSFPTPVLASVVWKLVENQTSACNMQPTVCGAEGRICADLSLLTVSTDCTYKDGLLLFKYAVVSVIRSRCLQKY
jgi:hypothetical protein